MSTEQNVVSRIIEETVKLAEHNKVIAGKIEYIMGGDDPELVIDVIADDADACRAIMDIAAIDTTKQLTAMPMCDVQALAAKAYRLNRVIAANLAASLGSDND